MHRHKRPPGTTEKAAPRLVAWETTRRCPLDCRHCRGAARNHRYEGELSTEEGFRLIDGIAAVGHPILILTGGEPMARPDIYQLAAHGTERGLRVVMSPCGHLLTPETTRRLLQAGVKRISISLDGPDAASHDAFRGVEGAFEAAMRGLRFARDGGLAFQVNTTVTRENVQRLPEMLSLAVRLGAAAFTAFFLVPTGRGAELRGQEVTPEQSERWLKWLMGAAREAPIQVKPTCAPHYARIARQAASGDPPRYGTSGCMAGDGFIFVSHRGGLQPCGFLDVPCGDLRRVDFDFGRACRKSEVFRDLRRPDLYRGKCGVCEFRRACRGCRARAYTMSGDYLDPEPTCPYEPQTVREKL